MNFDLEKALVDDFPQLYAEVGGTPEQTCMYFGFECGDGWEPIIRRLSEKLEGKTVAVQVKEKFGGLRFYVSAATDEVYSEIDRAEAESMKTCEKCGKPGHARRGGWIRVLCDECNSSKGE